MCDVCVCYGQYMTVPVIVETLMQRYHAFAQQQTSLHDTRQDIRSMQQFALRETFALLWQDNEWLETINILLTPVTDQSQPTNNNTHFRARDFYGHIVVTGMNLDQVHGIGLLQDQLREMTWWEATQLATEEVHTAALAGRGSIVIGQQRQQPLTIVYTTMV